MCVCVYMWQKSMKAWQSLQFYSFQVHIRALCNLPHVQHYLLQSGNLALVAVNILLPAQNNQPPNHLQSLCCPPPLTPPPPFSQILGAPGQVSTEAPLTPLPRMLGTNIYALGKEKKSITGDHTEPIDQSGAK